MQSNKRPLTTHLQKECGNISFINYYEIILTKCIMCILNNTLICKLISQ